MSKNSNNKGGGARKYGRNTLRCESYRKANRVAKNKARRMLRHLKAHPDDASAAKALATDRSMTVPKDTIVAAIAHGQARETRRIRRTLKAHNFVNHYAKVEARKAAERRHREEMQYEAYLFNASRRQHTTMAGAYREAIRMHHAEVHRG